MSERIVIITGAGSVRAAGPRRPIATRPPLDADFFNIAKKAGRPLYNQIESQLTRIVGDYADEVLRSLEETTTLLYLKSLDSKTGSPAHVAFLNQLELIELVLARSTNDLPVGPRSVLYRLLRNESEKVEEPSDLTFITFNYDLMLERVLEEFQQKHQGDAWFAFPKCYRFSGNYDVSGISGRPEFSRATSDDAGVGLLKLHGSLNWHSSHRSKKPSPEALLNPKRKVSITNCPEVVQSLRWRPTGRRYTHLKPIIVPPVTGKRGLLHTCLPPVWAAAAKALKESTKVIIVGYSCPPLDFEAKMLLGENIQPSTTKTMAVVNPDATVVSRFLSLSGVRKASVYDSIQSYLAP